jgi:hypothetical protein
VVEGARLESVYTARYRGFESHVLRHLSFNKILKYFLFIFFEITFQGLVNP